MTYKDPKTGRERNLGQDNVGGSVWPWIGGRSHPRRNRLRWLVFLRSQPKIGGLEQSFTGG